MNAKLTSILAVFGLFLLGPTARAEALIQANCDLNGATSACTFRNAGSDPGRACTTARITHRASHRYTESAKLCSGDLAPGASVVLPLTFPGEAPAALCLTGAPPNWNDCELNLTMSDAEAAQSPAATLLSLVILLTTLWVYFDARRIGARKGLVQGIADTTPGVWAAGTFFLWIVVLPLYLVKRGQIKAAAQAAAQAGAQGR